MRKTLRSKVWNRSLAFALHVLKRTLRQVLFESYGLIMRLEKSSNLLMAMKLAACRVCISTYISIEANAVPSIPSDEGQAIM
jgi:hypothetical protein